MNGISLGFVRKMCYIRPVGNPNRNRLNSEVNAFGNLEGKICIYRVGHPTDLDLKLLKLWPWSRPAQNGFH